MGLYYLHSGSDARQEKYCKLQRIADGSILFTVIQSGSDALRKKCRNLQRMGDCTPPWQRRVARKVRQFTKDRRWDCIIYTAAATQRARSVVIYIGWPLRFYYLHSGSDAQREAKKVL